MSKRLTTTEFIEKSRKIHGDKYNYSKSIYGKSNRKKITIICPIHGEFYQTPDKHLSGRGCNKCGGSNRLDKNTFIKRAKEIHGNKYCYNKSHYVNNITPLKIVCKIHGEFLQTPGNHLSGQNCGKCIGNIKLDTKEFIRKSKKVHNNKYDYSKTIYGKNNEEKVIIICPTHGEFSQAPYHHLFGQGCRKCSSNISNKELKFLNYIKIPDTKENRQKQVSKFKVDGVDLVNNVIYEFLGDFWHGNPNKFDQNDYNKACHKKFGELYKNTFSKFKILKRMGYDLKYIWESDWDNWVKNTTKEIPIKEYN